MDHQKTGRFPTRGIPGVRYIFTAAGFLGFIVIYGLRVNINVAIVAMVNASAVYNPEDKDVSHECPGEDNVTLSPTTSKEGEFVWSPAMQGFVLGSFYYGYCVSQIPGGRLAELYSGKKVFGFGILISSIFTLLIPLAARWHVYALIFIRALVGLAQGVTMPAMYSLMGKWLPETEKGLLATIVYSGMNIGTIIAMPVSGVLCNSELFGGWPSAFYIFGIAGCCFFALWMFCVTESPRNHPWMTYEEFKYITANQKITISQKLPDIPWSAILKSVPFWALVATQFGQDWCFYTMLTDLPTFMDTILHFKIEQNGFLSSLPYLVQMIVGCFVGYFADLCIRRNCCSTEFSRKLCNTIGWLSVAVGLVAVCFVGCNVNLTIFLFAASLGVGGFTFSGYMLNHLDLSPEYAGSLMGISNTISNLTGFIAPAVVGGLLQKHQNRHQWYIAFLITVCVLASTGIIYIIFGTTKKQDWSSQDRKDDERECLITESNKHTALMADSDDEHGKTLISTR